MTLESLEKREVLSATTQASQQYVLELLNLARTNPAGAAQWIEKHVDAQTQATLNYYNVNLQQELQSIASSPVQPPLAYNGQLASAAKGQSQDQADHNFQSHAGSDGSDPLARISRAGYGDVLSNGEDAFAYATSLDNAIDAFLIDWGVADKGHRRNILQPGVSGGDAYSDVGVGIVTTPGSTTSGHIGPYVVTIDFGRQSGSKAQLLGVAFNDTNNDSLYSMGEGQGNVVVQAQNVATGQVTSTQTTEAGGYQVALDPGNYRITGSLNGQVIRTQDVQVGTTNVKIDFNLTQPWAQTTPAPVQVVKAAVQVVKAAALPAPVVTPTPIATVTNAISTPVAATSSVSPSVMNPMSWITSWTAYRGGKRIG